jgi:hypothetical protein
MKIKIFLILILSFAVLASARPQGLLKTLWNGATVDTVTATSADDTSRTFLNPNAYKNIFVEFYTNSLWRTFKVDYPAMYKYRLQYYTADSTYECQVYNDADGWIPVPVFSYSSTAARLVTVIKKTTNSFIRFRWFN